MSSDPLLQLLRRKARISDQELADMLSSTPQVVAARVAAWEADGADLREVARFVSEKLSSLDGVISSATHFRLKTYKENGFVFEKESSTERLAVSP